MRPVVPTYCYIQGCYNPEFEAAIAVCKQDNKLITY